MITISQATDPGLFSSTNYIVIQAADGMIHWTLTGIAILTLKGSGSNWRHEEVRIILVLPGTGPKWVRLQQWAPFVTLNSIKNEKQAVNAGWSVDSYRILDPGASSPSLTVSCDVAVRDIDGYVLRLGYVVHAIGSLEDPPPIG